MARLRKRRPVARKRGAAFSAPALCPCSRRDRRACPHGRSLSVCDSRGERFRTSGIEAQPADIQIHGNRTDEDIAKLRGLGDTAGSRTAATDG